MGHILHAMDEELAGLSGEVAAMGELAVAQVRTAVAAFAGRDRVSGARVADADRQLDQMDAAIERRAIRFIALHQPMADDLRRPIVAMKAAMNLERCGDLAKSIARRTAQLAASPAPSQADAVRTLGELVAARLSTVMTAYRSADAAAAHEVWETDTEVDALHDRVLGDILSCMVADPGAVGVCTHLLFATKNLERIGDHATNIAELVHYQVTGAELIDRPKLRAP